MQKAKDKSQTYFEKMEQEEWRKPGDDPEINPARALRSDPDFIKTHLKDAPNLAAVRALLGDDK